MGKQFGVKMRLDVRQFRKQSDRLLNSKYPRAVARGFSRIARKSADSAQDQTRRVFNLHSDYIPRGIRYTPRSKGQINAAAASVDKWGNLEASVYLRPGSGGKSLEFMVLHERGGQKTSKDGSLAIPSHDIKNYRFRTKRGRVSKRWKPGQLLKKYNEVGPNHKGNDLPSGTRRGKPAPFILRSGSTAHLVRRKSRRNSSLEFLYSFGQSARIKKRWGFEANIKTTAKRMYKKTLSRMINSTHRKK